MNRGWRDRLRDEGGLSIIEVTIASVLLIIVLFSAFSLLDSGTRSERTSQARNDAQVMLRTAVAQMTKEIRQATYVDSTSNQSSLSMKTLIGGTEYWVSYEVTGTTPNAVLNRRQCASPTSSTTISCLASTAAVQIADRVVAPQAFCYQFDDPDCLAVSPTSTLSAIHVSLQVSPVVFSQGTVTLATDVQLRNIKQ
jgi:Tfp pilus assembly protein PilV